MSRIIHLLAACFLMVAGLPMLAQETGGYWSLYNSKTFVDGVKSSGDNAGWSSYGSEKFDAYVQRVIKGTLGTNAVSATWTYEGKTYTLNMQDQQAVKNFTKDPKQYLAYVYLTQHPELLKTSGGSPGSSDRKELHRLSLTWTKPQQYVKLGEENKIYIDVKGQWDGGPFDYDKHSESTRIGQVGLSSEAYLASIVVSASPALNNFIIDYNFNFFRDRFQSCKTMQDVQRIGHDEVFSNMDEDALDKWAQKERKNGRDIDRELAEARDSKWSTSATLSGSKRLSYSDQDPWAHRGVFRDGSFMLVTFEFEYYRRVKVMGTAVPDQIQDRFLVRQYYLYKFTRTGEDVEVVVEAGDKPGEDEGTILPPGAVPPTPYGEGYEPIDSSGGDDGGGDSGLPPWAVPVGVGLGGGALVGSAIRKQRKKKAEEEGDGEEPPQEEEKKREEEKEPSTYKMIIYKEFGNTLMVCDSPQIVGARIEEITARGRHIDRPDLTARITVEEGENIKVLDTGLTAKYRCAKIAVEELPAREPMTGHFYFTFRDIGPALRTKLVFQIQDGQVRFFQENLTLPAGHKDEEKIPVLLFGVSEGVQVEVSIGKAYSASVETTDNPRVCYIHLKEVDKTKGPAGDYNYYPLTVKATNPNGHEISGTLPVVRMHMGIVFKIDPYVGCYPERFEHGKHLESMKKTVNGRAYGPALAEMSCTFLYWDKHTHKIVHLAPNPRVLDIEAFPLEAKDGETLTYVSKNTRDMTDEEFVSKLHPMMFFNNVGPDNTLNGYLFCNALLDPQSRRKVGLRLSLPYDDEHDETESYSAEQSVWIISQPLRQGSTDALLKMAEDDKKITENLHRIQDFILAHDLLDRIGPVYRMADMLLDSYDYHFGYDMGCVQLVRDTYLNFVSGKIAGANAEVEPVEYLGLVSEITLALAQAGYDAEAWLNSHGGPWTRIAVSLCTFGWADVALTGCKVCGTMIEVVTNPVSPGTEFDAFVAGVVVVGKEFLYSKAMEVGMAGGMFCAEANFPGFTQKLSNLVQKGKDKMGIWGKDVGEVYKDVKQYASGKLAQKTIGQLDAAKAAQSNAARKAEDVIKDSRRNNKWTAEEILEDELCRKANIEAAKEIKEFERKMHDYRNYRTPETKKAFEEACYSIQKNKIAQRQLELYKSPYANNMRSEYYRTLKGDYNLVDMDAKQIVVDKLRKNGVKVDEDDIIIFCATNSNEAKLLDGDTITRDRDVTILFKRARTERNPYPLPEEVPQEIAESAYGAAYKKRTGLSLKEGDQAVVQHGNPEMIGSGVNDLNRAFKKEHFGEAFDDLKGVANAFEHKPGEWIEEGAVLIRNGYVGAGLAKQEEGLRQALKLHFNSFLPRATFRGSLDKIPAKYLEMMNVLKHLEVKSTGPLSLSISEAKKILRDVYNVEIEQLPAILKQMQLLSEGAL